MSRLRDHCPRVDPAYSLMPRGGRRNGVPEFMKPHHTHYTQRLNISNVGQSARSFQGNYLSTFPDAGQYRRALCRLRIPRFAFSGSKVSEEARPLPRTNQSQQQRAEAEEQRCGFLPARAGGASRRAPPLCAPSAAARAGAAAAKLGCENESGEAKKCFSVHRRAQSTADHSRRRQARQRRQLGKTGSGCQGCAWVTPSAGSERGGGAATAAAWAGPCSHHLGDTGGTGDSGRSADTRMPPSRLRPGAALTIAPDPRPQGRAREAPRTLRAGTPERKLSEGGCPQPGTWKWQTGSSRTFPRRRGWRGGCCCGWEQGRGDTAELRRDQPRLKFLLSRCLFSGSIASGFPLASPRLPVPPSPPQPENT